MTSGSNNESSAVSTATALMESLVLETDNSHNLTRTENGALAYKSTLDACLDFSNNRHVDDSDLEKSWRQDPLITLKLMFQWRGVRIGKNDKRAFYRFMEWLWKNHPKTFLANMKMIPEFGYWKDLLELLKWYLISKKPAAKRQNGPGKKYKAMQVLMRRRRRSLREAAPPKPVILKAGAHYAIVKELRKSLLSESEFFRTALDICAQLFADALKSDLELMKAGKHISLAAKWCPSIDGTHDRYLGLSKMIALKLFPLTEQQQLLTDEEKQKLVIQAKNRLRKDVYAPLRRYGQVTEVFMSANEWEDIQYSRVHALCMKKNKKHFLINDEERFKEFLKKVEKGEATITASALLPHTIVDEILSYGKSETELKTLELQWNRYESDLRKNGALGDALAICDVSGSMKGTPLTVALALSLLTSSLCQTAFKDVVCTFSSKPEFFKIPQGVGLREKLDAMKQMNWTMNTDFEKVFEKILDHAQKLKLPADQVVKRVFVFSDMQFDEASRGNFQLTTHERLQEKFQLAGYQLPQIVYWNLRASYSDCLPVTKHSSGALLMSGFSGQMLKQFMSGEDMDMMQLLLKSISGPLFDQLKVVENEEEEDYVLC